MAKIRKVYWDSCAWLGLLNGEADKRRELEIIYDAAKSGSFEIWSSTIALIEVNKLAEERDRMNVQGKVAGILTPENLLKIEALFNQPFVKMIPLDVEISGRARKLYRETPKLGKINDAVHLASALKWNLELFHTYDHDDLIHLSRKFKTDKGVELVICYPDETTDGPLFAKGQVSA